MIMPDIFIWYLLKRYPSSQWIGEQMHHLKLIGCY